MPLSFYQPQTFIIVEQEHPPLMSSDFKAADRISLDHGQVAKRPLDRPIELQSLCGTPHNIAAQVQVLTRFIAENGIDRVRTAHGLWTTEKEPRSNAIMAKVREKATLEINANTLLHERAQQSIALGRREITNARPQCREGLAHPVLAALQRESPDAAPIGALYSETVSARWRTDSLLTSHLA